MMNDAMTTTSRSQEVINYENFYKDEPNIAKYTIDIDAFGQQINFTFYLFIVK